LNAAKGDLDRLTRLHAEGIVSTRDYNAAKQAYEIAKAAAGNGSASGSAVVAPTSGTVTSLLVSEGQYVEAGAPVAVIAGSATLTLRANLPEREVKFLATVNGAKFRTSYSDEVFDIAEFNGRRSSDLTTTVATQGYIPVYFILSNNGTLSAGSYCEVYLTGSKRENVMAVPTSALSEQQGEYFVYVRLDEDCYEKRPVKLGASSGNTVEIRSGIQPGEEVVTAGTTFVRLAESSGVVPEGHSHNH
ncbi:MAG: efflux RND transporter periplasmic adaptor subunit, partial [Muribaculaceae bacterium]|nr:efflux RND transporter periplasmic adaptor subunit [Muribaculaceae bacterium]